MPLNDEFRRRVRPADLRERPGTPEELLRFAHELGEAQRGEPERAMLAVQHAYRGGILNYVVEHVGDLTHRMTHLLPHDDALRLNVQEKVERSLSRLTQGYGFEREMEENIRANARVLKQDEPAFREKLTQRLARYAAAHRALPVFNRLQLLARDSAVAVGEQNWDRARELLRELLTLIEDPAAYERAVREFDALLASASPSVAPGQPPAAPRAVRIS